MLEMFNTASRPFFSSTQTIGLVELQEDRYGAFIRQKFEEGSPSKPWKKRLTGCTTSS